MICAKGHGMLTKEVCSGKINRSRFFIERFYVCRCQECGESMTIRPTMSCAERRARRWALQRQQRARRIRRAGFAKWKKDAGVLR